MILSALLKHYRRHPVQAAFLVTSIALANMLLVGTQLINAQARASYAEGEQVLRSAPVAELRARDPGRAIDERDYLELRQQGFDMLVPALERQLRAGSGEVLDLLGIDALAMPRASTAGASSATSALRGEQGFAGFSFAPWQAWVSEARLQQLGYESGARIALPGGRTLPPLRAVSGENLGHRLLIDIGALQELSDSAGELSAILVFKAPEERLADLRAALPSGLVFVAADTEPDPAELTRSFHLNLAAMGLLAFVVGVFLTFNALSFSYTDRQELLRKLRLAGVMRGELVRALLLELLLFLAVGSLIGGWLGGLIASALLPGVGRTLAQLYGVYIAYPDALAPGAIWLPLAMTGIAALLCIAHPLRQSLGAPLLRRATTRWQERAAAQRDGGLMALGIALLGLAAFAASAARGVPAALAGMAALLLGAALCLPIFLRTLLALGSRLVPRHWPRARWLLADSRWLLGPGALALMAMALALVANSGLNTMIASFRHATAEWLQQRLPAELYIREAPDATGLAAWLEREAPSVTLTRRFRTTVTQPDAATQRVARIEVVTLQDDAPFRAGLHLLRAEPDAIGRFARGEGILVSERGWRLDGHAPGEPIRLCADAPALPVLGVYPDYGNPRSQWLVAEPVFQRCWPELGPASMALTGPADIDWTRLRERLLSDFALGPDTVVEQAGLRAAGLAVFDRTFLVTNALNALTLLVAGIGVFCAASAIHHHRIAQQALLASLGLTGRERGGLLLAQWGLLGLLSMALVWPFGTVLAGYLAGVVTPVAFGWSFPLRLEWAHYGRLAVIAAASLTLAVLLPSLRLWRAAPAAMLRDEPS